MFLMERNQLKTLQQIKPLSRSTLTFPCIPLSRTPARLAPRAEHPAAATQPAGTSTPASPPHSPETLLPRGPQRRLSAQPDRYSHSSPTSKSSFQLFWWTRKKKKKDLKKEQNRNIVAVGSCWGKDFHFIQMASSSPKKWTWLRRVRKISCEVSYATTQMLEKVGIGWRCKRRASVMSVTLGVLRLDLGLKISAQPSGTFSRR